MEALRLLQQHVLQRTTRAGARTLTSASKLSHGPWAIRNTALCRSQARSTRNSTFRRAFHGRPNARPSFRSARSSQTARRFNSTTAPSEASLSLSQRLKKLSREYGWSALGIYLFLSALDFPFCFLAVRLLGADRIGHWEHVTLEYVKGAVRWAKGTEHVQKEEGLLGEAAEDGEKRLLDDSGAYAVEDHGYEEARKANSGANASLWTQLALAYAIHKSFIFIRVPITAAITPKVVKTLRGWGWNIGKMPAKKLSQSSSTAGVNTKGSKVRPDD